jgi:hypothetical protein
MAVGRVSSEPLSARNSLLTGNFTGKFGDFELTFARRRVYVAQFTTLSRSGRPIGPKKNSEFILDIRELKFPDLHSSSEKL